MLSSGKPDLRRDRGAASMSGERLTVPALRAAVGARSSPSEPFVVTDDDDAHLRRARTTEPPRSRAASSAPGVGKGTRVGLLMPNGIAWPVVAVGASRAGATLVPLSTLLRPPELAAQLRTAGVEHLVLLARRSSVATTSPTSTAISPELVAGTAPDGRRAAPPAHRSRCGTTTGRGSERRPTPSSSTRSTPSVRPADDLAVMFTSGSRGDAEGRDPHPRRRARRHRGRARVRRASARDDRLYIPMPFFWVGGFGTGLLSALVAGATLLTEARPEPARTLPFLERERVTLFRGWPDQAAALARDPAFAAADLSLAASGQPRRGPARRRCRPAPGSAGEPARHDRVVRPVLPAYRLDRTLPPGKEGSCGRPFDGVEVRVVDLDTGAPVAAGETGRDPAARPEPHARHLRSHARRGVHRRRVLPDRRPRSPRRRRVPLPHRPARRHVQGARRDRLPERGRGARCTPSPSVRRAYVVDVVGDGGGRGGGRGRACVDGERATRSTSSPRDAQARLSSFKVPTRLARSSAPTTCP